MSLPWFLLLRRSHRDDLLLQGLLLRRSSLMLLLRRSSLVLLLWWATLVLLLRWATLMLLLRWASLMLLLWWAPLVLLLGWATLVLGWRDRVGLRRQGLWGRGGWGRPPACYRCRRKLKQLFNYNFSKKELFL